MIDLLVLLLILFLSVFAKKSRRRDLSYRRHGPVTDEAILLFHFRMNPGSVPSRQATELLKRGRITLQEYNDNATLRKEFDWIREPIEVLVRPS